MGDIRKHQVEETAVVELLAPDDLPLMGEDNLPMTITVYGPGSKAYAQAQAAAHNRMVDTLKRKGKSAETPESKAREQVHFLAACTKEFSANIECEGLKGEDLYRAVYSDPKLGFIAEQVGVAIRDWSLFTKGSTKP